MKKLLSFAIVALLVGVLLTSCKSKEEKAIDLMKEYAEKIEKIPADKIDTELPKLREEMAKEAEKISKDGKDLNFSDEQKKEMEEISKRVDEAIDKKMEEAGE